MNRWDELKGAALDVAQHVTQDPKQRDAMANDLITLVGLMVGAVGKCVAVEGESEMGSAYCNDPECDCAVNGCGRDAAEAHNRYLIGEQIQRQADYAAEESRTTDLDRWAGMDRDHGKPGNRFGWHPRCDRCGQRGGHTSQCDVRCGGTADGPNCGWDSNCPNGH